MLHRIFMSVLVNVAFISGCITTWDQSVEINDPPEDDSAYLKALDHATRDQKIIVNFETRWNISATQLDSNFRKAFIERFQRMYKDEEFPFAEVDKRVGFFVTSFSPERQEDDLTDEKIWKLSLQAGGKRLKPALLRRLGDKPRWRPFFPAVHYWSYEYLVLFDADATTLGPDGKGVSLIIANADASVKLDW